MVDFFGNYRDPQWDNMDTWKEEIEQISENIPVLETRIVELEKEIEIEKRRTWASDLYKQADPESTVSYNHFD